MSPLLSPHVQLERLNSTLGDILALLDVSGDDIDPDRCRYRRRTYIHLKQIQINACLSEICLLRTEKDGISWREYFRSMKKVYFDVRAFSKEVKTIRIDVKIVDMETKQHHFLGEKDAYVSSNQEQCLAESVRSSADL